MERNHPGIVSSQWSAMTVSHRLFFVLLPLFACIVQEGSAASGSPLAWPSQPTLQQDEFDAEGAIGHRHVRQSPLPAPPRRFRSSFEASETGTQLSLESLLNLALEHNPTLKQAAAQISAETGKAIQAGLYPNPVIRYAAEQLGIEGTAGEFQGGIVSQEVVRGGKLKLSRAKFLQRVKTAEALALAQQFRVTNDVRILFFEILALQSQVDVQAELVKSAEDLAVTAREAYNMGQANAAQIRHANVTLRRARLDLLARQNRLGQARISLSSLVGIALEDVVITGELESELLELDFDSLLSELLVTSPEILAARCKLEADRITVARERVEPIPNLQLEGGVGYNVEAGETVAAAGVGIRLPLFDRNQGTIRQARADMARQCAELERLQYRLQRDLATQYSEYLNSAQSIEEFRDGILPDLREAYRLQLESYRERRIAWDDVLHAQTQYFQARHEYFDWLSRLRKAEVLIDGMLLRGGWMAAAGPTPGGHIDAVAKPR